MKYLKEEQEENNGRWTSIATGGWLNVTEEVVQEEVPEWLVMLDHAVTLIMTCNTITLMLGMGAATYWKEIWHHLRRPWGCMIGVVCQFVLLPAVGFGLCIIFQLPPYQALGVLILTCSPGGAFSNFFTYWVDGDLALR
ncbi:Solute carrier family 10 member 6-like 1 [Homarus americanus]|uniref:Solute carrier family 10 member 6-like 1 n=1 Tax=Homarus americanus TaxID=6706 RepID=A0A8J5K0S7_HOMAM|nr:Solute carrier family 10 member 6-like 1 [Homarus americanus]